MLKGSSEVHSNVYYANGSSSVKREYRDECVVANYNNKKYKIYLMCIEVFG
jgi:hypothetical protein